MKKQNLSYDDKIDNWAVGILTYELLTGASPFAPPAQGQKQLDQNDIYRNIQNVDLCYNKYYETNVSNLAKDFIKEILNVNPQKRLNLN